MNLEKLNPQQQQAVMHVNGPLLISAGAGSGKTFTLTQRIAYALSKESGPAARGVDHVLAITFTEKAAEEIKSRVRRTLRNEGYLDEALKVDDSWIGTIHGACSRILRTYALELGIDPEFQIIDDLDARQLKKESIAQAIASVGESDACYGNLLREYPLTPYGNSLSVESLLNDVLTLVSQSGDNLDAFTFGSWDFSLANSIAKLMHAYAETAEMASMVEQTKSLENLIDACTTSCQALHSFMHDFEQGYWSSEDAFKKYYAVYEQLVLPSKAGIKKYPEIIDSISNTQRAFKEQALALSLRKGGQCGSELLSLAKEVLANYEAKKTEQGVLDKDDLLNRTCALLRDNPEIAEQYRSLFDIVMVDEFQDTNSIQIMIVSMLCKENLVNLCTVGDEQQSIYRFRGADVDVYRQHKKDMRSADVDAKYIELNTNYRSSPEVLSFVDDLFGDGPFASSGYMALGPKPDRDESKMQDGRINLIVTRNQIREKSAGIEREAEQIALRFKELSKTFNQSDMVLLLGKTTHASTYAEAIRRQGLECIIAGGSIFAYASEVDVLNCLVQVLVNPADTVSLHSVLSSEMFALSTQDMLALGTVVDEQAHYVKRRDINGGFALQQIDSLPYSDALNHAIAVIGQAQMTSLHSGLTSGVQEALLKSGWLSRLEEGGPQGIAVSGNIFKAIRILEICERETAGLRGAARRFADYLGSKPKEAPGTLNVTSANAVRIMTIHASKGLEFDVVAVAQFDDKPSVNGLMELHEDGMHYLSMTGTNTFTSYAALKSRSDEARRLLLNDEDYDCAANPRICTSDDDLVSLRGKMSRLAFEGEMDEVYRKFYVALTRAKEVLIVGLQYAMTKDGEISAGELSKSILARYFEDTSALNNLFDCGHASRDTIEDSANPSSVASSICSFTYGGKMPGYVYCTPDCEPQLQTSELSAEIQDSEMISSVPSFRMLGLPKPFDGFTVSDFISYTSLSDYESSEDYELHAVAYGNGSEDAYDNECNEAQTSTCVDGIAENPLMLGIAFHRISQYVVEFGDFPSSETVGRLCSLYGLSEHQQNRLLESLNAWFTNDLFKAAMHMPFTYAEVGFTVGLGSRYLTGQIDLLCGQGPLGAGGTAILFDYKTGGSSYEDAQSLYEKHLLQAQCYAYALMKQGYSRVEAHFVRVEQATKGRHVASNLETVDYTFSAEQLSVLEQALLARCDECLGDR